ncbi:hypothetical protein TEA_008187 [Camellia sinensis var. sinensis]|uniref:Peptidylprolyl isomerase n=1 Tax=Camellia sinensis var. sinensis TaxID=542762 RepID=A0A4S4EKJ8_CAMSN|nr:hypothetical protein TEA_008187 [Camellia sinensis var. sinensis]
MSAYCRRITAGTAASTAAMSQIQLRRAEVLQLPREFVVTDRRRGIALRSSSRRRWVMEAVGLRSDGGGGVEEEKKIRPCSYAVGDQRAVGNLVGGGGSGEVVAEAGGGVEGDRTVEVLVAAGVTVVLGVGNRVLYKLALVPLKHYPFFLAQLATFGYVIVYFSILYLRYHAGIVTDEMLSLPKAPFLAVGLLEALGAAAGMAAGGFNHDLMYYICYSLPETAILSGAAIPILSQSFLVWQLLLSYIFLGRRYRFNQLLGCFLVAVGVIITVASGSSAAGSLMEGGVFWSLLMIVSFLFQAADTVLKEVIFLNAAQQLKGRTVDLFVVNSYGSAFQALFIFLLLPFLSKLWGIPFYQLPNYLKDGAACFLNNGTISSGCNGAPLLPLLFVIVNMGFNISLLHLIKISSAVVSCLASTVSASFSGESTSGGGKEILVQHLLVKEDDLKLLVELQKKISEGEDLSDLAVEYSICPSKEEGGMLGWVRKGQMVPEFEEAAFNASVNKVVRCKTKFGWHLLQVLSEREESVLQDIQPDELHGKMQDPCFIEAAQLIDVREPDEVAQASLPGFHVLPLRQFGSWGPEITTKFDPQKDTYVLGFSRVFNVSGGIHAYAVKADPSIPTY